MNRCGPVDLIPLDLPHGETKAAGSRERPATEFNSRRQEALT